MTEQAQAAVPNFKVKAHVTLQLLKIVEGSDYYVTLETAFKKGEAAPARKVKEEYTDPETGEVKTRDKVTAAQEPPTLCQVTNLLTGMRMQMIAGSVLHSEIEKQYPNEAYVGKSFKFKVFAIQGKRYKGVEIAEIEVETPASEGSAPEAEKPAKKK